MTRSEMQKRSPFLEPPGVEGAVVDRYGPGAPDWSQIPPWRQTSFFGIRAPGRFFVYVIDCSESMIEEDRFARATMEVRRSVLALQAPQQFEVIFYNDGSIPMPGGPKPRPADSQNKSQLRSWLRLIEPDGGTDPRSAIRQALMLRPEAVFLLSDGEFPDGTAQAVAHSTRTGSPSIAWISPAARAEIISAGSPGRAAASTRRGLGTFRESGEQRRSAGPSRRHSRGRRSARAVPPTRR